MTASYLDKQRHKTKFSNSEDLKDGLVKEMLAQSKLTNIMQAMQTP